MLRSVFVSAALSWAVAISRSWLSALVSSWNPFDELGDQIGGEQFVLQAGDDTGFDRLPLDRSFVVAGATIIVIVAAIAVLATDGVVAITGPTAEQAGQ